MKKVRIILITIWTFIVCPTLIYAVYSDTQISKKNTFSATSLDMSLMGEPLTISIRPGVNYPVTITLTNIGELPTTNVADIEYVSGDLDLYNLIDKDVPDIVDLNNGESSSGSYIFSIDPANYIITSGKTVKVRITVNSFEIGKTSGFSDTESLEVTITNEKIIEILSEIENV